MVRCACCWHKQGGVWAAVAADTPALLFLSSASSSPTLCLLTAASEACGTARRLHLVLQLGTSLERRMLRL